MHDGYAIPSPEPTPRESDPTPEPAATAARDGLAAIFARALDRPAPDSVQALSTEIRRRHGKCVAAIVFYGSCLRRQTNEGVIDLFVVVDSYRAAYSRAWLRAVNTLLPPNVFYLELEDGRARAKYAVISTDDLRRCADPACLHSFVWARLCQPNLLAYARDAEARRAVIAAASEAAVTITRRMVARMPFDADVARFPIASLWTTAFAETYRAEWRVESPGAIDQIYEAAHEHFDAVGRAALKRLSGEGRLGCSEVGNEVEARISASRRAKERRAWNLRRPLGKAIAALRLLKSTTTFGDWVPYVLWKLERHTGLHVEPTARQRRHPLVWGWPLAFQILRERYLR